LTVFAEVLPKNNSKVHSTTIYFEENFVKNAVWYELCIYADSLSMMEDRATIILRKNHPAFTIENLQWAHTYYWLVKRFDGKSKFLSASQRYKFATIPSVNSPYFNELKLDVRINKTDEHAGGFLVIDYFRGIFDR